MAASKRTLLIIIWTTLPVLLLVASIGGSYALAVHAINASQAARARQGQHVLHLLCTDLSTMAAIQPPGGSPAANPSRAYEQAEHRAWAGLESGIGCRGATR